MASVEDAPAWTFQDFLKLEKEALVEKTRTSVPPADIAHAIMANHPQEHQILDIIKHLERWYGAYGRILVDQDWKVDHSLIASRIQEKRAKEDGKHLFNLTRLAETEVFLCSLSAHARQRYKRYACISPDVEEFRRKYAHFVPKDVQIKMIKARDVREFDFIQMYFTFAILQLFMLSAEPMKHIWDKRELVHELAQENLAFRQATNRKILLDEVLENNEFLQVCFTNSILLKKPKFRPTKDIEEMLLYNLETPPADRIFYLISSKVGEMKNAKNSLFYM